MASWGWDLFVKVHVMRIEEGATIEKIRVFLWDEIALYNNNPVNVTKRQAPSDTSLQGHFTKHVPVKYKGPSATTKDLGNVTPAQAMLIGLLNQSTDAHLEDFQKYHQLATRMQERFKQIDKELPTSGKIDSKDLADYRATAETVAKLLEACIKIRNQEKLMSTAVSSCLDTYTVGALQAILKGLQLVTTDAKLKMMNGHFDSHSIDQMESTIKQIVSAAMTESAKIAIDTVRQQYKMA